MGHGGPGGLPVDHEDLLQGRACRPHDLRPDIDGLVHEPVALVPGDQELERGERSDFPRREQEGQGAGPRGEHLQRRAIRT